MSSISKITINQFTPSTSSANSESDEKLSSYYCNTKLPISKENCFIQEKEILSISPKFTSLIKSAPMSEEINKIQAEIESYEQQINDLEISKKNKLIKVI